MAYNHALHQSSGALAVQTGLLTAAALSAITRRADAHRATTAMRIMRPLADQGHVTAQTVVGLMYYFNYGGDYVSAYMWFSLAAAQGNAFAKMFLRDTADKMTPGQIAEAQKLAREWKPNTQSPSR